jgi:hypothetical protein
MPDEIGAVKLDDFAIEPSLFEGCLVLRLAGMGDMAAVASLRECLETVKAMVLKRGVVAVELDIRMLKLLNSSCLKVIVSFLIEMMGNKSECPIRFIVDAKSGWQARSLFALERLASSIVSVVPR